MMGIIVLTLVAFILSIVLVFIEQKFNTSDDRWQETRKLLPGYNCGSCGFGSCDGMAKAILDDLNNYKKCKPLRGEDLKKMEDYINNLR